MRKHLFAWLLLAVLLAVAPGCDLVRASLGKPTSAELTAIRLAKEAREQAVRDSIAQAAEQARLEPVPSRKPPVRKSLSIS